MTGQRLFVSMLLGMLFTCAELSIAQTSLVAESPNGQSLTGRSNTLSSLSAQYSAKPGLAPKDGYPDIARMVAYYLPRRHLSHKSLDDEIAGMAWTNYISGANGLDYNHLFFLQSDIAAFSKEMLDLENNLAEGNIDFGYKVFNIYRERMRDRCAYVDKLLEKGFDLNREEYLLWKRKDAPWPEDKKEWDELWRKRIKNEYLGRKVVRELESADPESDRDEDPDPDELLSDEEFIRKKYKRLLSSVEDSGEEWVMERYLSAFASAYDPHTAYMSPSTVDDFNIEMQLSLVGVGALLQSEDGAAKVLKIIPGGPASSDTREKRLKVGDKIIAVAQGDEPAVDILHWPLTRIVKLIRGEKGSTVVLHVIPASDPTGAIIKKVDLVRDEVKLEEQAASSEIRKVRGADGKERQVGVITLPAFYASMKILEPDDHGFRSSVYDVYRLLDEFSTQNVDGVILDLRSNGGGLLRESVNMAGLFFRNGPVVMVNELFGRRALYDENPYGELIYGGPLVVMVNRFSASASEIVAGALKDYGRAVIVGDSKTHGKGSVQQVMPLGEDGMGEMKITTTVYYRVSGSSTQLKGVASDIVLSSPYDKSEYSEDAFLNPIKWDVVNPARYKPVCDLKPLLPELKRKSEQRRANNEKYKSYKNLLDRLDQLDKVEQLPLFMEGRRKYTLMEKEFNKIRDDLLSRYDEGKDEKKDLDLVLDETINILSDLITMTSSNGIESAVSVGTVPEKSSEPDFSDWLKKFF